LSSACSSRSVPPAAAVDLDYCIDDYKPGRHRDSAFCCQRIDQAVLSEASLGRPERVLDVACGVGNLVAGLQEQGCEAWGLEASASMLALGRWLQPHDRVTRVRGIAEVLPFRGGSFDRVLCKGSLDHFADPAAFMREAARILTPDGRLVIALSNYESLSCHVGQAFYRVRQALGIPFPRGGRYWMQPPDHTVKGDLRFVQGLGDGYFRLERCYGVSLLWLFGPWSDIVDGLPLRLAWAMMTFLDCGAYRLPGAADMIVSVWRLRGPSWEPEP